MIKVPVTLGLIFCDEFVVDGNANQVSLQGIFTSLRFAEFPTDPQRMSFATILTDGMGEGEMRLEVAQLFTQEEPMLVWRHRRWVRFPDDPLLVVNLHFVSRNLIFPVAGEYLVNLTFDGKHVTERTLTVSLEN